MSIKWMATVWEDATNVEGTELLVLLALADHAGDDGRSWPSVKRLCERARRAESTVQEALSSLVEKGYVERVFRPGRSTLYQMLTPPVGRTPPESGPPQSAGPQGSSVPDHGGPVGRTQNRNRTTNESSGGVGEVTTEATHPDHPVTEQPFPRFAIAALGSVTANEQEDWITAWRTVTSQAVQWDAQGHLTKYLARCKESKKTPKPTEWVRWWVEDEQAERRKAKESAASNDETPRPWFE